MLNAGDRDLALIHGKSWGKRPVEISIADPGAIDPGPLLFAAFVVHQLAVNAANSAGAGRPPQSAEAS